MVCCYKLSACDGPKARQVNEIVHTASSLRKSEMDMVK